MAEQWEPDERRGSRPVLRTVGGEIPMADSPNLRTNLRGALLKQVREFVLTTPIFMKSCFGQQHEQMGYLLKDKAEKSTAQTLRFFLHSCRKRLLVFCKRKHHQNLKQSAYHPEEIGDIKGHNPSERYDE